MTGTGFRPATPTSTSLTASSWSLPTPMPTTNRRSPPCRDCFRRIEWLASPVPIWSGASGRFTVSHNSNRLPIADWGLRIADCRKNETTPGGMGSAECGMRSVGNVQLPLRLLPVLFFLSTAISFHPFISPALAQDASRRSPVVIAVEKASPAVVSIISAQEVERGDNPFSGGDPFFDEFFRDFFEPFRQRQTEQSLGSGVVIQPDGYILTNEHVILRSGKIQVQFADERKFDARLVGADSDSDLAVLKVDSSKALPNLPLGNSDDLMIGETVIAIGNPFGLSHTVTTGVVSALNRSLNTDGRTYYDFIQTDASINPGNSGGPLLNIKGELVGINTAIYGKAQGIGFAIPISRAKRIVQELISHGAVEAPWIGLAVQTLTPELAHHFSLRDRQGVLIRTVEPGSPAARIGVERGDEVLGLSGTQTKTLTEFRRKIIDARLSQSLLLSIGRGQQLYHV